jgi:hypothetical protein
MRLNIRTEENVVAISADVVRIEIEDIREPTDEELFPTYSRTVRFVLATGDAIDVECAAVAKRTLQAGRVKELAPLERPQPDDGEWLPLKRT